MSTPQQPNGHATVNPFIITNSADDLTDFLVDVFGATVRPEARTIDTDGLVLHAEIALGDTTVMMADRKPDWPFTPACSRFTSMTSPPRSIWPSLLAASS